MPRLRQLAAVPALLLAVACEPATQLAANPHVAAKTAPTATTVPVNPVDDAIQQAFGKFGSNVVVEARKVFWCESKHDTAPNRNPSPTGDWGLAQVNERTWNKPNHPDPVARFIGRNWHNVTDPYVNAEMAARIYGAYGWKYWSCKDAA